jgi:hypothetical protein
MLKVTIYFANLELAHLTQIRLQIRITRLVVLYILFEILHFCQHSTFNYFLKFSVIKPKSELPT